MSTEEAAAPSGVTVVKPSSAQREGLFGFLVLAFAIALVRGALGASSTTVRVAVVAVFGAIVVAIIAGWGLIRGRAGHIEVSDDEVRYVSKGQTGGADAVLSREEGSALSFVTRSSYRTSTTWLYQTGTVHRLPLPLFARKPLRDALAGHGWRVS